MISNAFSLHEIYPGKLDQSRDRILFSHITKLIQNISMNVLVHGTCKRAAVDRLTLENTSEHQFSAT